MYIILADGLQHAFGSTLQISLDVKVLGDVRTKSGFVREREEIRMAWVMVIAAGLLEMVWSYSAKRSDGFTRLGWAGLTVIASLASFCLLVFSMRRLPLGTAYGVWTGIGATGSFLVGIAALGESANVWRIASAALIVLGVCGLRFTSIK